MRSIVEYLASMDEALDLIFGAERERESERWRWRKTDTGTKRQKEKERQMDRQKSRQTGRATNIREVEEAGGVFKCECSTCKELLRKVVNVTNLQGRELPGKETKKPNHSFCIS